MSSAEAAAKPEQAESSEAGLSKMEYLRKTYLASALVYNDLVQSVDVTKNRGKTAMMLILRKISRQNILKEIS